MNERAVHSARRRRSPTRWLIWIGALLRLLAYPYLIASSVAVVATVAKATPNSFWSPQSYGGVMLAAALSGLALALIRLGDGRFETEKGKYVRRNARHASAFWLSSFIVLSIALFLVNVLHRFPGELETPWLKARAPRPEVAPAAGVVSGQGRGGAEPAARAGEAKS